MPCAHAEYRDNYLVDRWQPIEKTAKAIDGEQSSDIYLALPQKEPTKSSCAPMPAWHAMTVALGGGQMSDIELFEHACQGNAGVFPLRPARGQRAAPGEF